MVVDQAKVMRISRPADIVIIGNPAIADATIQDNQTLIITGHSFGTTNLIVLDASGQAIAEEMVTVGPQNDQVVTVYKRSSRDHLFLHAGLLADAGAGRQRGRLRHGQLAGPVALHARQRRGREIASRTAGRQG